MKTALIIVDVQNDFLQGGALAVKGGNEIIKPINQLLDHPFDVKVASKDWHPINHESFSHLWPPHCIQGTYGAEFAKELDSRKIDAVFYKGEDPDIDSYSAFFDNESLKSTGLYEYLQARNITQVYIAGLATDYCVKYTAIDAVKLKFKTYVILDACRPIDNEPLAIAEMKQAGVDILLTF